jgi:hypothetical protein
MFVYLFKALLIVSVLLSSVGGTAVTSDTSLPGSPVYPIKLMMEEARLAMSHNFANQAGLHLAFAQERAEEMAGLAARNQAPSAALMANYQAHWREALRLAGQLSDGDIQQVMEQAQQMARVQQALLDQAGVGTMDQVRTRLQEAEGCLAQVQTAVALGLQSQNAYRWQMQNVADEWPGGNGNADAPYGPGECPTPGECDGNGNSYGPGDCETPGECVGDNSSYGPGEPNGPNGPSDCENPGECDGDGNGNSYGPGDCETPGECVGDNNSYGPGEPNGPNGPGDCANLGDCDGDGDGNSYGPGDCENPGECDGDGNSYGPGDPNNQGNEDPGHDGSGGENGSGENSGGHGGGGKS